MATKIAINGFGRIGRIFFREAFGKEDLDIVAVNDLGSAENLAYLLKYDTVYKQYGKSVEVKGGSIWVDGKEVKVLSEKDPSKLPWKDLGVDIVIESTGIFETAEKAKGHLDAGAKRVVISAPAKDDTTPTATPNVGFQTLSQSTITSNASCTTNCVNPVVAILMSSVGIKKAMLNTVHGYTATQMLVDGPGGKDFRRGRAAAQNIVPSTTGAAKATTRIITELEGKFDGIALRVPVVAGSLIDLTFIASRPTTVEEVNGIFKAACATSEWSDVIAYNDEQIVSSDILGNTHGSIFDATLTKVVDGDLVKVFSWYDNEYGYTGMLVKHVREVAKLM